MNRLVRLSVVLLSAAWLLGVGAGPTLAQCAMCKAATAGLDANGVARMNIAVLMLLTPPVTIFCGFFYAAYKRRRAPEEHDSAEQ